MASREDQASVYMYDIIIIIVTKVEHLQKVGEAIKVYETVARAKINREN